MKLASGLGFLLAVTSVVCVSTEREVQGDIIVIDAFSSSDPFPSGTLSANSVAVPDFDQTTAPVNKIIGGTRGVRLDYLGGSGAVTAQINPTSGGLVYSAAPGVTGQVAARYDANSTGLNADLTQATGVVFSFTSLTGTVDIQVQAFSDHNDLTDNYVQAMKTVDQVGPAVLFNFAEIGTATLNDVDLIQAILTPSAGGSFALGSAATIPEPSTVGLTVLGLAFVAAAGWRCKQRKVAQNLPG